MLKRIKIQGYKSLVNVEVHLQPLTVLFGPNASGKSNFLDALQLLSRIANSHSVREAFAPPYRGNTIESFSFSSEGVQGLVRQEKVSFTIEVDVELSQSVIDAVNREFRAANKIKKVSEGNNASADPKAEYVQEENLRYRIEIEMFPKAGKLQIADEALTVMDTNGRELQGLTSLESSESSFLSLPAYRYHNMLPYLEALRQELVSWFFFYLEPRERMRMPTLIKEVRHIGLMGEELATFLNTLRALDEPQFIAVEKALHTFIPSFTGIDVGVNNAGEVELRLMQGQTSIPARVVSEGTLRILGLLALGGAKEPPSLLGFEEPENGIHPDRLDLIAILLENLAGSDIQVIVTTHSPTLLDLVPIGSLYACRRIDGATNISSLSRLTAKGRSVEPGEENNRPVSERLLRGDFDA